MMTGIVTGMLAFAVLCAVLTGQTEALAAAAFEGAKEAVTLGLSIAGGVCLWSGVGEAMRRNGMAAALAKALRPLLGRLFPKAFRDPACAQALCANVTANLLGLGNAATPMGIRASKRMAHGTNGIASDELCRLVVLNTASIQLLPTTVAALRASLGAESPLDILPAVWLTSACSVTVGLVAAALMAKRWR